MLTSAAPDTTLEESHMKVAPIRRLTVTERSPDIVGRRTRLALKAVGPGAAALPQHEEVCGREALSVRLSSHWKGRSYCHVVRVQEKGRCRQEEGELQNFGQEQSDG
jgi:hypothetical protein